MIETDASNYGIGAVIMQDNHPIAFFNKKIGPKLQASSTYIKELHAITEAVRKWRQYLLGRFFVIQTYHKSIKELLQQVIQTAEQQVYVRKLLGYQFCIKYKQGISNKVVDALSRFPNNLGNTKTTLERVTFDGAALFLACISAPLFDLVSQVHSANTTDTYLLHLHEQFQQGKLPPPYSIDKDILYFNGRFVLSTTSPLITLLLQEFHDTPSGGHAGIKRTLVRLAANFFWPKMRQSVINYISQCPIC